MERLKTAKKWLPFLSLPVIMSVCLVLWVVMSNFTNYVEVESADGVWDLRNIDFAATSVRLVGEVEYIPNALLSPEEFEARSDEIKIGYPENHAAYSTSRMRILLPEGATYTVAGQSIDYSDRIYINGKLMAEIGSPGEMKETIVPNTATISLMDEPAGGVIQIVQQTANFVHRTGGEHTGYRIGYPGMVRATNRYDTTVLMMGCFLALFLVHMTLFFLLRSYRANLYFSLFCLAWFFRSGVTGSKVFSTMFPALSWIAKFRIEYLSLPVTGILFIFIFAQLFPGVFPRWYQRAVIALSAAFAAFFLAADSLWMSWAMIPCYGYLALSILAACVFFARGLRRINSVQAVSLMGMAVFFYAGIRDMLFYSDVLLPPFVLEDLSQISMLIFVFFQMTAMFMGTVNEVEKAKAAEERLIAQNAALDRVNRMKGELIATISHETRTPLAVLGGYVWLIAAELRKKGLDEQMAADLNKVVHETQRIASLMEGMRNMTRTRDPMADREAVDIAEIIRQTARLFTPLLERNDTELLINIPDGLPPAHANADEITQVLFNLLSNARNHTHSGQVTIAAEEKDSFIVVSVCDTGEGIREEFLPRAFERGEHDNPDGSGLGLTICKEIVEAHAGKIEILSERGSGTTVRFALPIDAGEE